MKVYDYVTGEKNGEDESQRFDPPPPDAHANWHRGCRSQIRRSEILDWGINHKYFQYDHVTSNRQVGSTFKPFVYGTAIIDQAISPCYKVQDIAYCIQANDSDFGLTSTWCPSNSDGKFSGSF